MGLRQDFQSVAFTFWSKWYFFAFNPKCVIELCSFQLSLFLLGVVVYVTIYDVKGGTTTVFTCADTAVRFLRQFEPIQESFYMYVEHDRLVDSSPE